MNHTHDSTGAVILGGSFACLEAARNLDKHGVRVCVLGSASSVARFSRSVGRFVKWPRELKDEELPDFLVAMAEQRRVRGWVLFPTSDEHIRIVAQHHSLLAEYYVLTTPPWETVRFFYDKRLTYTLAQSQMIGLSEVIVQDFLPEPSKDLFSFAGYFKKGETPAGLSVKRTRQLPRDFGRTITFVEVVDVPELRELAGQLLRSIHYTGLAEAEFMWNPKHARFELLEANARLGAWHGLTAAAGLDLPYVAFADALGQNPSIGAISQGGKWVRLLTDVLAAAQEILSGTMTVKHYLTSLRGTTAFAVFSPSEHIPFIVEPFLLLLDRLNGGPPNRGAVFPLTGAHATE